jgi:hypothetical protein
VENAIETLKVNGFYSVHEILSPNTAFYPQQSQPGGNTLLVEKVCFHHTDIVLLRIKSCALTHTFS